MSDPAASALETIQPTPLAAAVPGAAAPAPGQDDGRHDHEPLMHLGAFTARAFDGVPRELHALLRSAAVYDLGWQGALRVTGADAVRWLNGMVSNTVRSLPENEGNYSFLLNAQGRILGDCWVYRSGDDLLIHTSRAQLPVLLRHLDHFIIMDDVELRDVSDQTTALGLAGPDAPRLLSSLGLRDPQPASPDGNALVTDARFGAVKIKLIQLPQILVPRYELWFAPEHVRTVWDALREAGATPAGLEATEALRVLEGVPLYGVDLTDRDLPQETGQSRALNFNKGCYLGQEIVERIRSRAKVHRSFSQFALEGATPALPAELSAAGKPVGRLTSAAAVSVTGLDGVFALGSARIEALEGESLIQYDGGTARPLKTPPRLAA